MLQRIRLSPAVALCLTTKSDLSLVKAFRRFCRLSVTNNVLKGRFGHLTLDRLTERPLCALLLLLQWSKGSVSRLAAAPAGVSVGHGHRGPGAGV